MKAFVSGSSQILLLRKLFVHSSAINREVTKFTEYLPDAISKTYLLLTLLQLLVIPADAKTRP